MINWSNVFLLWCAVNLFYTLNTNSSFIYTKCNTKHTWRQRCDLKRPHRLCYAVSQKLTSPRGAGVMPRNWQGKTGRKAPCPHELMPRSRWYWTENGAPGLHQSPAPSRLSWFLCTGRWRSRPHWTVSRPLHRNPPDCRRCPTASWWPPWRAGPAEAPFPPHWQKHRRWDPQI